MGYVPGKGLGKKGEGIVNPVKAVKTKELGNSGPELLVSSKTEEEEEEEEFQQQLQQWQKQDSNTARPKYVYKTLNELKETNKKSYSSTSATSQKKRGTDNKVKVIDMTGKETKILNSYSDIRSRTTTVTTSRDSEVYVPELLHNLEILVADTEADIIHNDHQLQYNQDMIVNLTHERDRLEQVINEERGQVQKLTEINNVIEMFEDSISKGDTLTLFDCEEILSQLQMKYPTEYKVYDLSSIAVAVVFPKLKRLLEGWDMLTDPTGPFKVFHQWRQLLRESEHTSSVPPDVDRMDAYDRLMWEIWMPKLRRLLLSWSPRGEVSGVISLLESWMPLLPEWIICNILESIVLPKLQSEVDIWNPTSDPVPIHSWIHPWLPLMDKQLEVLFPTIRMKMGVALNNWQPSDSSALIILRPWIKVFSPEVMEAFLCRTVVPKLDYTLQSLVINPQHQIIAPVQWVLQWREALPLHHFVHMFNKHFFPKWLQVLNNWLSGSPNYDEVVKWYTGWKGLFDKELINHPTIKANFNNALSLMDHAAHGTLVPGMRENMVCFTTSERRRTAVDSQPASFQVQSTSTVSFKDVIEKKAEELGIVFVPLSKRYEGKQLHSFGDHTVYIDRGVLFLASDNNKWTPIALNELINLCIQ